MQSDAFTGLKKGEKVRRQAERQERGGEGEDDSTIRSVRRGEAQLHRLDDFEPKDALASFRGYKWSARKAVGIELRSQPWSEWRKLREALGCASRCPTLRAAGSAATKDGSRERCLRPAKEGM